jgi:hypothetical protein
MAFPCPVCNGRVCQASFGAMHEEEKVQMKRVKANVEGVYVSEMNRWYWKFVITVLYCTAHGL